MTTRGLFFVLSLLLCMASARAGAFETPEFSIAFPGPVSEKQVGRETRKYFYKEAGATFSVYVLPIDPQMDGPSALEKLVATHRRTAQEVYEDRPQEHDGQPGHRLRMNQSGAIVTFQINRVGSKLFTAGTITRPGFPVERTTAFLSSLRFSKPSAPAAPVRVTVNGTPEVSGPMSWASARPVVEKNLKSTGECCGRGPAGRADCDESITVQLKVAASGAVADAYSSGGMELSDCVQDQARKWRFPKSKGETELTFRLRFQPETK